MSLRASAHDGTPVNLYRIEYGENEGNVFLYTNADESVDYEGETYLPVSIRHGTIKHEGRPKETELHLTVSRKSTLAEHLRGSVPRRVIRITIFEGDLSLGAVTEVSPIWHGRIVGTEPKGHEVKVACAPAGSAMRSPALTRTFSRQCNIPLYGELCKADKAAATYATTVASLVSTVEVTLTTGWEGAADRQYFLGGIFEWTTTVGTEHRAILEVNGDTILVDGPLNDLEVGDSVNMVLGCPRTMDACRDLHNNINNFGGCPFVPIYDIFNKNTH